MYHIILVRLRWRLQILRLQNFLWKDCKITVRWRKRTLSSHNILLFRYRRSPRYITRKRVVAIFVRFYDSRRVLLDQNMLRQNVIVATIVTSLGSVLYWEYFKVSDTWKRGTFPASARTWLLQQKWPFMGWNFIVSILNWATSKLEEKCLYPSTYFTKQFIEFKQFSSERVLKSETQNLDFESQNIFVMVTAITQRSE
jgi:hypothetical protein